MESPPAASIPNSQRTPPYAMKILIAYASAAGSTKSIAERIETRLQFGGLGTITLSPISSTLAITGYDVLIIGACIHIGWLHSGASFLKRISPFLKEPANTKQPLVFAFSVGLPPNENARAQEERKMDLWVRKYVDVRGHRLFMGSYKPPGGRVGDWLWKRAFGWFLGDVFDRRDWGKVEEWVEEIVEVLRGEDGKVEGEGEPLSCSGSSKAR